MRAGLLAGVVLLAGSAFVSVAQASTFDYQFIEGASTVVGFGNFSFPDALLGSDVLQSDLTAFSLTIGSTTFGPATLVYFDYDSAANQFILEPITASTSFVFESLNPATDTREFVVAHYFDEIDDIDLGFGVNNFAGFSSSFDSIAIFPASPSVPEPGTSAMLGLGIVALGCSRYRSRSRLPSAL